MRDDIKEPGIGRVQPLARSRSGIEAATCVDQRVGHLRRNGAFHKKGAAGLEPVPVQQSYPFGPSMFSGRTMASNCSAVTKPSFTASSFSVVPFLCAVLATMVALS